MTKPSTFILYKLDIMNQSLREAILYSSIGLLKNGPCSAQATSYPTQTAIKIKRLHRKYIVQKFEYTRFTYSKKLAVCEQEITFFC